MFQTETFFESFSQNTDQIPIGILIVFAFAAGLISSLSPCVLSMLPMNIAYIGATKITSKAKAFEQAIFFVLGVSVLMAFLGAFSNFAFAVFTECKAYIYLAVGFFILIMALVVLEWIKIPLPQFVRSMPDAHSFVIGLVFALVSSPCSSPVLFAVLSAAATLSSWVDAVFVMFAYSLGYTAIIFWASLFAGLIKQLHWFKAHNRLVIKISAFILILLGLGYIYSGYKLWF